MQRQGNSKNRLASVSGFYEKHQAQASFQEPGPLTSMLLNVPGQNLSPSTSFCLPLPLPSPSPPTSVLSPLSPHLNIS